MTTASWNLGIEGLSDAGATVAGAEEALDTGTDEAPIPHALNDTGNANAFTERYADRVVYVPETEQWLTRHGHLWAPDDRYAVLALAKEFALDRLEETRRLEGDDAPSAAATWALSSGNRPRLTAMLELAKPDLAVPAARFDAAPFLAGVENGILDLEAGALVEPQPPEYITKRIGTRFDSRATGECWGGFIDRVTEGDPELAPFLQRCVGYSLCGDVSEHVLFFLYGNGANGKSTFLEILRALGGDYSEKLSSDLIVQRGSGSDSFSRAEAARLKGARVAVCGEIEDRTRIAAARLKDLTGGEAVTAKALYRNPLSFDPTHHIWVAGNHLPDIHDASDGLWRRLFLIPFKVQIPVGERDRDLPARLRAELPGILNWALEGLRDWKAGGLRPPAVVEDAVRAYRSAEDALGDFIARRRDPGGEARGAELYQEYKTAIEADGRRPVTNKQFAKMLRERGIEEKRASEGIRWIGLKVLGRPPALRPKFP